MNDIIRFNCRKKEISCHSCSFRKKKKKIESVPRCNCSCNNAVDNQRLATMTNRNFMLKKK